LGYGTRSASPLKSKPSLRPIRAPLAPGVEETDRQHGDEDQHLHKARRAEPAEGERPREQEDRFDVEDQEQQGEDVVAHRERMPGVADRLDAALVGGVFLGDGWIG